VIYDGLYLLGPRDQANMRVEPFYVVGSRTGTVVASAFSIQWLVPNDRVAVIMSAHSRAVPGAAQTLVRQQMSLGDLSNFLGTLVDQDYTAGVGVAGNLVLPQTNLILGPGVTFNITTTFSAVNAGNAASWSLSGLLIPRGNLSITGLGAPVITP
jgi:hypothetical protein